MNKRLKKDIQKRLQIFIGEKKILLLKFIIYSMVLSKKIREKAFNKLILLSNFYSYKTQIKNRCIITSRGRGVLGSFKLSRITFRRLASYGFLPGIKKSSW